jgi:tetratricopeptide (TPR) repeat protein
MEAQDLYDDAMFDFSRGDYAAAIEKFHEILASHPTHFDAQLSLGMAHYRLGDYPKAIEHGHKAEGLRPNEQLVHTNLSLFYMRSGNKTTAEHHGLQARIASWRENMSAPVSTPSDPDLAIQTTGPLTPIKLPEKFPDMPWKKKAGLATTSTSSPAPAPALAPAPEPASRSTSHPLPGASGSVSETRSLDHNP